MARQNCFRQAPEVISAKNELIRKNKNLGKNYLEKIKQVLFKKNQKKTVTCKVLLNGPQCFNSWQPAVSWTLCFTRPDSTRHQGNATIEL